MDLNGRITEAGMADHFEKIGIARLDGYCFRLNKLKKDGTVAANLMPDPSNQVYGVLYKISDTIENIYLDKREGYPNHYSKIHVTVSIGNRQYHNVITYIANPKYITEKKLPVSFDYEAELKRGGADLPEPYKLKFLAEIERHASHRSK